MSRLRRKRRRGSKDEPDRNRAKFLVILGPTRPPADLADRRVGRIPTRHTATVSCWCLVHGGTLDLLSVATLALLGVVLGDCGGHLLGATADR